MYSTRVKIPPHLLDPFVEVKVVEILVEPGDPVVAEQSAIVVDCEKATLEISCPHAGVIDRLLVELDDIVVEGSDILVLRTEERIAAPSETSDARQRSGRQAIFISYRREDSADICGRIYDRLVLHFGKERIFKDVDSIPIGIDFQKHLSQAVGKCSVFLAIVGRNWNAANQKGGRRLDDPLDFLRIEVLAALSRDIPIVPVLVQGVSPPSPEELPADLKQLAYRQGAVVRNDPDFHNDMERLIRGIETHFEQAAVFKSSKTGD